MRGIINFYNEIYFLSISDFFIWKNVYLQDMDLPSCFASHCSTWNRKDFAIELEIDDEKNNLIKLMNNMKFPVYHSGSHLNKHFGLGVLFFCHTCKQCLHVQIKIIVKFQCFQLVQK
jgi:hypothetical protein